MAINAESCLSYRFFFLFIFFFGGGGGKVGVPKRDFNNYSSLIVIIIKIYIKIFS